MIRPHLQAVTIFALDSRHPKTNEYTIQLLIFSTPDNSGDHKMDSSTPIFSTKNRLYESCRTTGCRILFLFVVLLLPNTLRAATYYVDATGGNDGFVGTSPASAWKTINKVNSASFAPGDRVLLKRGERWHESLVVPSSGDVNQPVTFGAYGSGYRPILDGTYAESTVWQQVQGNIYRTIQPALSADPGLLVYKGRAKPSITTLEFSTAVPAALNKGAILLQTDGLYTSFWVTSKKANTVSGITFFTINPTKNEYVRQLNANGIEEKWSDPLGTPTVITSLDGLTEPGHWYWDDQTQSVYLYSDTDPNALDVQIARLFTGIYTNGKSFLNIQDITVQGFQDLGVFIRGTENSVVENMHVSKIGARTHKTGILLNRSQNNIIQNNVVDSTLRVGIGIYGEAVTPYCLDNIIRGNFISNTGSSGISLNTDAPSLGYTVENNELSDNTIIGANALAYDSAGIYALFVGGGNTVLSNTIKEGGSRELRSSGIMIEGGNDPAVKPVVLEKNIIENNSLAGIAVSGKGHRIAGNILRYNGKPSWETAQMLFYTSFGENASSCTVENNVMEASLNQKLVSVFNGLGPSSPPHIINNNTYYSTNPTPFCWSGWSCDTPLDFVNWNNDSGHDLDSNFTQPVDGMVCPAAICDDGDIGFDRVGSWSISSSSAGFYGSDYLHDQNKTKGGKIATWTYMIDVDGNYEIAGQWADNPNRAADVQYRYSVDGGTPVDCGLPVDQRLDGGRVNSLCTAPALTAGSTLTVRVRNDSASYVIADAVQIKWAGTSAPPAAAFSFSQANETLRIDFDASASSDPDGTVVGYDWDFGDGTVGSGRLVSHLYSTAGIYSVTLMVTDDRNTTNQLTRMVMVESIGTVACPAAICDNTDAGFNTIGSWSASSSSPGFYGSDYLHDQNNSKGTKSATWTYLVGTDGNYEIAARWTDNPNRATGVQYRYSVDGGMLVDCGLPVDQRFNGGGFTALCTAPALTAGSILTVHVRNESDGYVIADAVQAQWAGISAPPTAAFSFSQANETLRIDFDASASSDPDGTITAYNWDFGDGAVDSGQLVSHTYSVAGSYTVILKVTDDQNTTNQLTQTVSVQPVSGTVCAATICDNSDIGFSTVGSWTTSSSTSGFYGSNYLHDQNNSKGTKSATWTYLISGNGNYEIAGQWPSYPNRAAAVQYRYSVNADTPVDCGSPVDQRLNGGRFNVLCTVPALTAGSTLTVDIDNESGGYVIADAVRVIKQ